MYRRKIDVSMVEDLAVFLKAVWVVVFLEKMIGPAVIKKFLNSPEKEIYLAHKC